MSKELKALKRIVSEISNYKLHGIGDDNWLGIQDVIKDVAILEKALTPPTADEVCEVLSDYLKDKVTYDDKFGFICNEKVIISLYPNNVLSFNNNYPAHIHNIVGRFYEGVN